MTPVDTVILESIDSLTPTETRIARSLLASYPSSATRSSSAIARAAGVSAASVIRFVTKLGFGSMHEFHEAVRAELDARMRSPFEGYSSDGTGNGFIETVIQSQAVNTQQTLRRLTSAMLADVASLIGESSAVFTLGGRFSHVLARYLAASLQLIRPGVIALTQESLADRLAQAGRSSCLVAFDFRRYDPQIELAARYIKMRRGHVVLISDPYLSPASRHSDRTLIADIETPRLFDCYAPALILVDTIISELVTSSGELARKRIRRVEEARALLDPRWPTS